MTRSRAHISCQRWWCVHEQSVQIWLHFATRPKLKTILGSKRSRLREKICVPQSAWCTWVSPVTQLVDGGGENQTLTSERRNNSGVNPSKKQPTNIATDMKVTVSPPSMIVDLAGRPDGLHVAPRSPRSLVPHLAQLSPRTATPSGGCWELQHYPLAYAYYKIFNNNMIYNINVKWGSFLGSVLDSLDLKKKKFVFTTTAFPFFREK